jgi:Fe-S cluster assembly protein SufD
VGEKGDLKSRKGGKFHALNQAIFDGGYTLHVPKGVKLANPYQVTFTTRAGAAGIFPHNLIVVEDGAEAVLIEKYTSEDPRWTGLSCPQTEILLGRNAKLHYILLQEVGQNGVHIGAHRMKLMQDAKAIFPSAHLGAKTSKTFMEVEMAEPNGHAVIYGLYYGLNEQKIHLDTWQHHAAPNCVSDLMFKGALDHKAFAVYRGMIRLEEGAQKTDAYQQNRTLLLSDDASVNSIPGLEILANDVRCTHGSTAGQIDPQMLFYLLSRGLTNFEARKMIMDGFFEEVILKFGLEAVLDPLRKEIDAKIDANAR